MTSGQSNEWRLLRKKSEPPLDSSLYPSAQDVNRQGLMSAGQEKHFISWMAARLSLPNSRHEETNLL